MMVGKHPFVYTYYPFAAGKCHSSQPEFLMSFYDIEKNPNFTTRTALFPSKVKNMNRCKLTVTAWNFPPYIFLNDFEKTRKLTTLRGIEGFVITLLADRMNFSIAIKQPSPIGRGAVYPNGTATLAAKMIIDREVNISVSAYTYNAARADVMLASTSYHSSSFVLAIPDGRPMTPIERLSKPFRYIIWSCFSSSVLFAILVIYFVRLLGRCEIMDFIYGHGNRRPFTNLIAVLFGVGLVNKLPYRNFSRYLLTVWMLYTFVLRSAYSGELFKILQDRTSRNIMNTLEDVVYNNYTIYAFATLEQVIKESMPEANVQMVNTTEEELLMRISKGSENDKIVLCSLDLTIQYYNQLFPQNRVRILRQPVMAAPLIFYMPRHSYMRLRTTNLILNLVESGLIKRYRRMILYSTTKVNSELAEPVELSFHLLRGIFWIYGGCLVFSGFVLIMEILSKRFYFFAVIIDFLNM
ncbi:probable glutamate receptor [Musca autumnalis]|uniref:probable glutamate receptor n=1 Tax=Musca autumnalis TaxID=221902 RepID=UPI003CE8B41A